MFCGLEERFIRSLWEIRVCMYLEDDFQGLRNKDWDILGLWCRFEKLWGYLGRVCRYS